MFRRRLIFFWLFMSGVATIVFGRLVQIQVVEGDQYSDLATRLLTTPTQYIRAPRGAILDRAGRVLVRDEPSSDVCIHFAILAGRSDYLWELARARQRRGECPPGLSRREVADMLHAEVRQMWERLGELTGVPVQELRERAARWTERVDRIRAAVQRYSPTVQAISEENELLPVIEDVDPETALRVRLALEHLPWLRVVPGSRRVAHDADALVHVIGRTAAATRERMEADRQRDDELRSLRPGERCGSTGIERLADVQLRGARGKRVEDLDKNELLRVEPQPGRNVYLTLDLEMQRRALAALEAGVKEAQYPAGAAAVAIDVATREVVVLASYPIYSAAHFNEEFDALRDDTRRLPLTFRAVAAQYPPGSTCKALTLIGGLSEGVLTPETRVHCTGHLLPDNTQAFRCWIYNSFPGMTHDATVSPSGLTAEEAIKHSCNIYFFRVGELLGPERLCAWFERCGFGRVQGTGLIEESPGIVPDAEWMARRGRRYQSSDAWNFAIGQGEVTCTPLQAANVAATIASGHWAPVRLAYDETGEALGDVLAPAAELDETVLRVLRAGMWRVVNEPRGTAYNARLDGDDYELCGKTGSAQSVPRVVSWRYTCRWPDGREELVVAPSAEDVLARFADDPPEIAGYRAAERYPELNEGERLPSHAWFIGYTQPRDTRRGAAPEGRVYAISVLIEFGGSGGRIAGPVAKALAEALLGEPPPAAAASGGRAAGL